MNAFKIFIHGLESSNQGTKSIFFRERYPDMILPNFPGNLQQRMAKLNAVLSGKSGIRLVGSSFGGLMATIFAMENEARVEKIILLAPAIHNLEGSADYPVGELSVPAWVFHGKNDDVIPLNAVERTANNIFRRLSFHMMDDDHSLHKTFETLDWDGLLID